MKLLSCIATLVIFFSCNDGKERVVDISDTIPKSQRDYDDFDSTAVTMEEPGVLEKFQKWDASITDVRRHEKRHFLERFGPKRKEKYVLFYQSGDSVVYERLVYEDSLQTKSAFYNWMDRSNISHLGDETVLHPNAFAMLYSDTVLLQLQGELNFAFWEKYVEQEKWIEEGDLWLKQPRNRRMKWYTYTNGKLEEFKQP